MKTITPHSMKYLPVGLMLIINNLVKISLLRTLFNILHYEKIWKTAAHN